MIEWHIEPEARCDQGHADDVRSSGPRAEEISLSIAISLKRIADVVTAPGLDFATINNNIEQMAWNAGRSFQQGTRTDR